MMALSPAEVAEAFSRHRFSDAYPYIAEDVHWDLVGGPTLIGKTALVDACQNTLHELDQTDTDFIRFRTLVAGDTVVTDSLAVYDVPDGASRVASCDLFDFRAGTIFQITSYTVEVPT